MAATTDTIHASCVAIKGRAVLITGASGSGKSDLALRLIDRGAALVSDDYTAIEVTPEGLKAMPPPTIAGKIEVRGVGIVDLPHTSEAPVALYASLDAAVVRLPEPKAAYSLLGIDVPMIAVDAREASAPIKIELALARTEATA